MIKDGKALLVKGYGLANVENDVTVSSDTVHRHVAPVCSTYRTRSKHARLDAQVEAEPTYEHALRKRD